MIPIFSMDWPTRLTKSLKSYGLRFFPDSPSPKIQSVGTVIVVEVRHGLFSTVPKDQAYRVARLLADHFH